MQGIYILRFHGTYRVYIDWGIDLKNIAVCVVDNLAEGIGPPKLLEAYKLYGKPKIAYIELKGAASQWYLHAQACYFMQQFDSVEDGFNEAYQYTSLYSHELPTLKQLPALDHLMDALDGIKSEVSALRRTLSP